MSYFLIIRGPLASGKSTIAQRLAEELPAWYVPIDTVLEEHGLDKAGPDAESIPAKNFIQADDIILPVARKKLQIGKNVIFDACFYHRDVIYHLVQNLPYAHFIFTLKAPVEVCIARDAARPKSHGEDAARAVHDLVSRFDYGINIDATLPIDEVVQDIRAHLTEQYEKQ